MANLIEDAKKEIDTLLSAACAKAAAAGLFPADAALRGTVEIPKDARNGDYAANHAMAGARALHMPPRKIAEILADNLDLTDSYFASAEIAPCPGGLKRIEASVPTPHGTISIDLHFDGDTVHGTVTVPEEMPATFKWRGATRQLTPGENAISF